MYFVVSELYVRRTSITSFAYLYECGEGACGGYLTLWMIRYGKVN